ncbi:phosphodiesterase [Stutzerimonas chloritidismutans]|uniref:phosphodiesterase n=1 Tax=Stutzerimonas chloritidismutans TaxID=203192 RepID=UPI003F1503EC
MRFLPSLIALLLCTAANAEVVRIPVGQQGLPNIEMPARGDSKNRVLDHFGLADEEHPAVGRPPITRWDYREFSVYFEGDRVIDSVRHRQPVTAGQHP